MSTVICVGSVAKDLFFPTSEGEFFDTPEDVTAQRKVAFESGAKYQVEDRYEALGGVAANTSVGLSRLGVDVSVYGAIGDDDIGAWICREFEREGVDIRFLEQYAGVKSDLSSILVFTAEGDRTIFYNRDAAERFRVKTEKFSGASWVMMSALNGEWKVNMQETLRGAEEAGAKLVVNPGQRNVKDDPLLVLRTVSASDILFLNKDEAIELSLHIDSKLSHEMRNDEKMLLRILRSAGATTIAMTDGMRGAWGMDGETVIRAVSRNPSRGIETTGAGDAFGSGFLAATVRGESFGNAFRWGMANGASVVRHFGAIEGLLREDTIQSRLDDIDVSEIEK